VPLRDFEPITRFGHLLRIAPTSGRQVVEFDAIMCIVSWEEVRVALGELATRDPCPLSAYPDPRAAHRHLPASITLWPWAVDAAGELHERFGTEVSLTVGFLTYPIGPLNQRERTPEPSSDPVLDPADMEVVAGSPLVVRAGEDLRTELQVTNHRPSPITISTGRSVFGRVLDPSTGEVVGGFSGAVATVARFFAIEPGVAVAVPLVVGTASHKASLGYSVPCGDWLVEVVLRLGEGERRVPLLPLRIVEWGTS
jgi:hypothetical protein